MERIWYLACLIAGIFIALLIFGLGYRKLAYPGKNSRWFKELWFSTMVILALLTTTFCNKESSTNTAQIQQHQTQSFTELQKIWQRINQIKPDYVNREKQRKELDEIQGQIDALISRAQQELGLKETITLVMTNILSSRVSHIGGSFLISGVTCYKMSSEGVKRMQTLSSLEQQYALLAKMYQEKKIDVQVLTKARETILSDYENLIADWNTQQSVLDGLSSDEKNKVVDFIMELSGVEAKEHGQLESTPEWKAILAHWEVVSQLEWDQKTSEELDKIHQETEKRLNALLRLVDKGLLSIGAFELIQADFKQLQQVKPINVDCYSVISISTKIKGLERLQARLPLLEKTIAEGKINEWTYQKVIRRLKDDLQTLDNKDEESDKWYKGSRKLTDADIEAVKKKAKELIEKIEKDGNYK